MNGRNKLTYALLALLLLAACGGPAPLDGPATAKLSLSIEPQSVTLAPGQRQRFVVEASGGALPALRWSATGGSLEASGATVLYTAPAHPAPPGSGGFFVTATSLADAEVSVTAAVTVSEPAAGRISGTVSLPGERETAALVLAAWPVPPAPSQRGGVGTARRFVPGDIIVRYKAELPPASLEVLSLDVLSLGALEAPGLERVRALGLAATHLYRDRSLGEEATLAAIRRLSAHPDVLYAQPNFLLETTAASLSQTPNDPHYALQWHYPAINLPQAWALSTGAPETVVAVVDTGILFRAGNAARSHPDLAGKVLPGYDFISDPAAAGDGDGRDPDPYDEGDNPGGQSSYHGSHVAGTVAAATNNGAGVAGVNWGARLLPVRVLGAGGRGTLVDVLDGVLWAAGFSVAGVPKNAHPAQVINLSLGGPGACSRAEQEAYDKVVGAGAVVVVAAGNSDVDAGGFTPASCAGVITVGATDSRGQRAFYSNYGPRLDVMAPGGDMRVEVDLNRDGHPDGVLSLGRNDATRQFGYAFTAGTSMAAPHVAGLVALMKGLRPELTAQEVRDILRASARPLSALACGRPRGSDCGAGLIDAFAALEQTKAFVPSPAEPVPQPPAEGATLVAAFVEDTSGELVPSGFQESRGFIPAYGFAVPAGDHHVVAWWDADGSGEVDEGDYLGFYPEVVSVMAGTRVAGLDFTLERVASDEAGSLEAQAVAPAVALEDALRRLAAALPARGNEP